MSKLETPAAHATHEVDNQATPLENYNVFEADRVMAEALVGPLSPTSHANGHDQLIEDLATFCVRSVTEKEPTRVKA